ncbi:MAG: TolC family protein [Planctomycetota bacterium]
MRIHRLLLLAPILLTPWMVACHTSLGDLDREVAAMIDRRQNLSLGKEGAADPQIRPPRDSEPLEGDLYRDTPDTTNPRAADLPTRDGAPRDQSQIGRGLDSADDPEALQFDLPKLLGYAITHGPDYRSEKEDLFLSALSLIIERHEWGPRFFNALSGVIDGTPESGDFDTAASLINSFTATQRLPYGGDISVNALVNYTSLLQQASTNTGPTDAQTASIGVDLNLPLLRGRGMVAREDLIQAERDLVYATREFERFRREFFVDISNTYFDLQRQLQSIENQKRQLNGLLELADRLRALADAGRTPGFEADDAEAQVLFGQSNLIRAQDNYQAALDRLKIQIGMPTTQPLVIQPTALAVPTPALDTDESIRIAQSGRLDLQTTADRVRDARRQALVSRDQLRGDLDLTASADLRSDSDKDIDVLDFELADSSYRIGLEYDMPLDRKIELAQYRQSLVQLERSIRNYRVERDRVALEVRDAIREIERSELTLQIQERNVQLANRRVEDVEIRRQRGFVEPRRVIEAEEDLLDARNSRDEALSDLQSSILRYLLDSGQMRVGGNGDWLIPGTLNAFIGEESIPSDDEEPDPPMH